MSLEALNHSITPTAEAAVSFEKDPEDSNPSTAATMAAAVDKLEVALNPTAKAAAVQSPDMAPDALNSAAAAEAEAVTPPSPRLSVRTFGPLPKKPRSKRPRFVAPPTLEEYLAQCLFLLAQSNCSGGSATSNTSNSVNSATTYTPINNDKKTDFLQPQNRSYECTVCNKSFTTYQALGGHKASHRKKPTENNIISSSAAPGNVSAFNPTGRAHVCSVCHKSFNTGQALGGHKRLHYEGQIGSTGGRGGNCIVQDYEGQIGSTSGEGGKKIVHDFDLNNLPAQSEPESESGVGLNVDSEMKTEVYGDHEADQGPQPMKKRRLKIQLDLRLSLSQN